MDYAVPPATRGGTIVAKNIHYQDVVKDAVKKEGVAAFYTVPKWAARVMMNAPVQGTLPWFYNEVLSLAEELLLSKSKKIYDKILS